MGLLLAATVATAQTATQVTLTEAGTLETKIGDAKLTTTSIKVSGPINGKDILCLREMAGGGLKSNSTTEGSLTEIDLSDANIVSSDDVYYQTSKATFTTKANELGESMFNGYKNITKLVLPTTAKFIGKSFANGCAALTSIAIPAGVTKIEANAFYGCKALEAVTFAEGSVLDTIENSAFSIYGNTGITEIALPATVKTIGSSCFTNLTALKKLTLPTSLVEIGNQAFQGLTALTDISELPATLTTLGDNAFQNTRPTEVKLNAANTTFKVVNGVLFTADGKKLVWYPAGNTATSYTIPEGVETVGKSAFFATTNIKSLNLSGLTMIDDAAFRECGVTGSLVLPETLKRLGSSAFYGCTGITDVTFGAKIDSIGASAFNGASNLAKATFTSETKPTTLKNAIFRGCAATVKVIVPTADCVSTYQTALTTAKAVDTNTQTLEVLDKATYTNISGVTTDKADAATAIYSLSGVRKAALTNGVNIIKTASGKTKKVIK
jgi:hypothetical protein